MKTTLPYFIIALVLISFSACQRKVYTSASFDQQTLDHKKVAILPAQIIFTGKMPKNMRQEDIETIEEKESIAFKKFEKLRKAQPEFSKIEHRFVTEVGFADERISSAIKRFDVDLLIIPESIQRKLEENFNLPKEKFTSHFQCSVLLMTTFFTVRPRQFN